MEYINTVQFAELKGCTVQYARRFFKEQQETITQNNPVNNRPQSLLPVSALPDDIRAKYNKQKQQELGLQPELKEPLEQRSKTVKTPVQKKRLDEFTEAEREEIAMWCDLLKEWQAARARFKNRTEADPLFCAKVKLERGIDISPDILYRKYRAYCKNDYCGMLHEDGTPVTPGERIQNADNAKHAKHLIFYKTRRFLVC